MTSKEALEELYRKDCCVQSPNPNCGNCDFGKNSNCKLYNYYMQIKQDLEDYSIIKEIEDNVRAGKRVILNDKKYYACEFILAEEGTIRHLTISNRKYKTILRFEDYKKSWEFED